MEVQGSLAASTLLRAVLPPVRAAVTWRFIRGRQWVALEVSSLLQQVPLMDWAVPLVVVAMYPSQPVRQTPKVAALTFARAMLWQVTVANFD